MTTTYSTSGRAESVAASLASVKLFAQCTPSSWNSSTSGKTCIYTNYKWAIS